MAKHFPLITAAVAAATLATGTVLSASGPASAQQVITCASNNGHRATCPINNPQGLRVRLIQQLSSESCAGNWGSNGRRIWVTNGCRAQFAIGRVKNNGGYGNGGYGNGGYGNGGYGNGGYGNGGYGNGGYGNGGYGNGGYGNGR